ncbi:Transcriptional regulator, LuxR family [Novosphingobium resinovorum]|uniref:Transcriptional regulator, LuxR family n=1 Tax=Novosphingobium resinovorum TaxID=158500 RepID=A0A031K4P8_9SPHN|nr:LuxR family transcriptional regulator [Novosphingobium lentum]EZP83993.1 Transcriptional regulator, LuxR family [Novosphingobium resinovorum]
MKQYYLTEELAFEITNALTQDELFTALSAAAERLGFDHFALAYDRRGGSTPASLLVHDYPAAWAQVYVDFDLGGADPVRRAGERSMTGFEWRSLPDLIPLTKGDRQMLEVGRENGIADGFTVPRHLPGEASGACSFVIGPNSRMQEEVLHVAEIVGAVALSAARRLVGVAPPKGRPTLSERQRECVLWTARGKTASEVGAILGISEETVIQHLKTARDRYDVHCRQMLILCALFDGLIGFADIYDWWHDH